MKKAHLEKLRKAYFENRLIPFIGTGISAPFGIPDWGKLISIIADKYIDENISPAIDKYIKKNDYWKAISVLKDLGNVNEFTLQQEICDIVSSKMSTVIEDQKHNYKDLAEMNFRNYLTTNYDFLLNKYLNNPLSVPQILFKVDINSQTFFEQRDYSKVWHLHGHVGDVGSVVISKDKYDELYKDDKYKDLFLLFQGHGTLLFLGFSFTDQYIQEVLKQNNKNINSQHFILLDNPSEQTKDKFSNDYGINVIEYNTENGGHAAEIRRILNMIKQSSSNGNDGMECEIGAELVDEIEEIPLVVPTNEERENLEKSLFCKKLRVENIDDITLDYSKDCFFMSDISILNLRKKGFSENFISKLLVASYMAYMKVKVDIYKNTRSSQLLIEEVHKILGKLDFSDILNKKGKKIEFEDFQKQGLIHVLADDMQKNVWWGERRINE